MNLKAFKCEANFLSTWFLNLNYWNQIIWSVVTLRLYWYLLWQRISRYALIELSQQCIKEFSPILDYFENNVDQNRANQPRFPSNIWCLCDRCMEGLARSSCYQEAWHGAFSDNIRSHPTANEFFAFSAKFESSQPEAIW
jgi:hypothetical protein